MVTSATDGDLTFNATTNTLSSSNISIANDLGVTGATTLTGNLAVTAPSTISGYGTIPIGGIIMWSGTIANIPTGWALCNGSNSTPDLRNRFVVGAHSDGAGGAGPGFDADNGTLSSNYTPGNTGGYTGIGLTIGEIPSHSHTVSSVCTFPGDVSDPAGGGNNHNNTSSLGTSSAGGDKFHENRPPYYALAFIMRIS